MNFAIQSTFKLNYLQYATLAYSILIFSIIVLSDIGYGKAMYGYLKLVPHYDKIGHFMVYGFWSFLLNYSFNFSKLNLGIFKIFVGSIIAIIMLSLEEYSQSFFVYRDCNLKDLIANYSGILIFGILSQKIKNYLTSKILIN